VEVREGDQKLGRVGEQAEKQAHHGGGRGVLGRAQGVTREGFLQAKRFTRNIARASCLQEPRHGCQGGGRRVAGLGPVADGSAPARVCAAAACHRPRGRRHVTPVGAQCCLPWTGGRWPAPACAPGGTAARPTWHAPARRRARELGFAKTI
jgi:hypothetical protein